MCEHAQEGPSDGQAIQRYYLRHTLKLKAELRAERGGWLKAWAEILPSVDCLVLAPFPARSSGLSLYSLLKLGPKNSKTKQNLPICFVIDAVA